MPSRAILVSGASGLIGSALVSELERVGHRVLRLVRREPRGANELRWNPSAHLFDERQLATVDVIVNLAGETIAQRWTTASRRRIRDSRVAGTDAIVTAIGKTPKRSMTLINASAIGFYGDRGDDPLDEKDPAGRGFLAEICRQWETAATAATRYGARVVTMRTGLVLSPMGGALAPMLMPYRLVVGGRFGNGKQLVSWIGRDQPLPAPLWLSAPPQLRAPGNITAPI